MDAEVGGVVVVEGAEEEEEEEGALVIMIVGIMATTRIVINIRVTGGGNKVGTIKMVHLQMNITTTKEVEATKISNSLHPHPLLLGSSSNNTNNNRMREELRLRGN